jgi:hypothetical protein
MLLKDSATCLCLRHLLPFLPPISIPRTIYPYKTVLKRTSAIKTNFVCSITFPKIVAFIKNVKKYGRVRHATDGNIIRRMRL